MEMDLEVTFRRAGGSSSVSHRSGSAGTKHSIVSQVSHLQRVFSP